MTDGRRGARPPRASRPTLRRLLWIVVTLGALGWAGALAAPEVPTALATVRSLGTATPLLLGMALLAEAGSLLVYSLLTRVLLARDAPTMPVVLAIDLTALGLRSVVPGGAAVSAALRLRSFSRSGVPLARTTAIVVVQAVLVALALCSVFAVGIAVSAGRFASDEWVVVAAVVVAAVIAGAVVLVWLCMRRLGRLERTAVRATVPLRRWSGRFTETRVTAFVHSLGLGVRILVDDPRSAASAFGLALGNWVLDVIAFGLVCTAVGADPGLPVLLVVYGLGNLVAMLPITPGGVGIVESAMVSALVLTGTPSGAALLGVVGWRVLEYWLPILAAGVSYPILRVGLRRAERRRAVEYSRVPLLARSGPGSPGGRRA